MPSLKLKTTMNDFSVAHVKSSKVKNLFSYYTGLQLAMFMVLFKYLVPNEYESPVTFTHRRSDIGALSIIDQLFLVVCRLRNGFHVKDLAFRFHISVQSVSVVFNGWIKYMYRQLGYLSWWPRRDIIISNMPDTYRQDFPRCLAIIDCTELKTEKPSSLLCQSQCYSDYKSTTTLNKETEN